MKYINRPIHPILRGIYFMLRVMAWLGTTVFYRKRLIIGAEHARLDGPAIVISNHPSTLMDVLNVALLIRQELYFLANYGLFKHPVSNWILSRVFCIPIKRKEDVAEGESRNNDAAFEACFTHLNRKGLLFIAPEGVSWMHRWVRPFKTGTARIAFGAEKRSHWESGLKILPVGLSYDKPNLFRSQVTVHYGEPVPVKDWKQRFESDEESAVDAFSLELESRVRALSIDLRDEAGEQAQKAVESMMFSEGATYDAHFHHNSKKMAETLAADSVLREKFIQYQGALEQAGLSDFGVKSAVQQKYPQLWPLVLGFPLFLAGYLFWFLPSYLPAALARKLKLYIGYDSNVKTLVGLFTYGIALWLANWGMTTYGWNWHLRYTVLGGIMGLGLFTDWYMQCWQQGKAIQQARRYARLKSGNFKALREMREALISFIPI